MTPQRGYLDVTRNQISAFDLILAEKAIALLAKMLADQREMQRDAGEFYLKNLIIADERMIAVLRALVEAARAA